MRRIALCLSFTVPLLLAPLPAQASESSGGTGGAMLPMDMIVVPIVDSDRLIGKLRFKLVLEVKDAAAATRLGTQSAQLRMAALSAGNEFARLQVTPSEPVDVAALVHMLETALHGVDADVQKVLVVEVAAIR